MTTPPQLWSSSHFGDGSTDRFANFLQAAERIIAEINPNILVPSSLVHLIHSPPLHLSLSTLLLFNQYSSGMAFAAEKRLA